MSALRPHLMVVTFPHPLFLLRHKYFFLDLILIFLWVVFEVLKFMTLIFFIWIISLLIALLVFISLVFQSNLIKNNFTFPNGFFIIFFECKFKNLFSLISGFYLFKCYKSHDFNKFWYQKK